LLGRLMIRFYMITAKNIENDLQTGDIGALYRCQGFITGFNRDTVFCDSSLIDERVEGVVGGIGAVDGCGRAVQLHQVECVYSQVLPAANGPCPEVPERI